MLGSCGYGTGLAVKKSGIESIGVAFFGNDTLERDVERDFQPELARALQNLCDAPIDRIDRASTVIQGTIRQYHRRSGIRSPQNELLETGLFLEVEAALYLRGQKEPSRGPVRANTWVGFVLEPTGEHERVARERALRHVAEELVLDLFAPVH
ncbi:MAG: hypothetical protein IPJ77_01450 [Planctomycetes bacterium]|nr:hypothetical protein [Planctomycetota bacterium]